MSWDNKLSGTGSSIDDKGSNDWRDSKLQEVLNSGAYYSRTSGTCPNGQNGATKACDFTNNGLTKEAKEMIDTITWNLGASNVEIGNTTKQIYNFERGIEIYQDEKVMRPKLWEGQIGLMYVSDYGYATSGGNTYDRSACLKGYLHLNNPIDTAFQNDCFFNSWILDKNYQNSRDIQWTMTPYSGLDYSVFALDPNGAIRRANMVASTVDIRPTLYLKPEVFISGGKGTVTEPYTLSLN